MFFRAGCEIRPVFLSLWRFKELKITHGRGSLGNAPRFSHIRAKAIFGRFKTLSVKNGITYRPAGNMALKRKFARNNFFCKKKSQKLWKKFW